MPYFKSWRNTAKRLSWFIAIALVVISSAAIYITLQDKGLTKATPPVETKSNCRIIYDAGSSGTRLYIYKQTDTGWDEYEGPKVPALADPVRKNRYKKWSDSDDVDLVVSEVIGALPAMLENGPITDDKMKWKKFDWRNRCDIVSANIFATAGMRIAEQRQRERSVILWRKLKQGLVEMKLGDDVKVNTRTLSGYEEGLFTWLALVETNGTTDFGIAEMGGASAQITYPCRKCDLKSDSVRTVRVNGKPIRLFSHSFLGLGTDEAPRTLGFPLSCRHGIGILNPEWTTEHCADRINFSDEAGNIYDPYNFSDGAYGIDSQLPTKHAKVPKWYLTGGFNYMKDEDIDQYCVNQKSAYKPETSCFRAVYLQKYLRSLNLVNTEQSNVSWTKGANRFYAEERLAEIHPAPICRWSAEGCL